jgi:hypothetical protein
MASATLEERVAQLERRVDRLEQVKPTSRASERDWRSTVGMFRGDAVVKEMIDEALRMREEERRRAREDRPSASVSDN